MDNINNNLNKALIVGAVILLAGIGVWWLMAEKDIIAKPAPIKTAEDAVGAVTSPEINAGSNPVENKVPEVNPVDLANPFKDSYRNPFE